MSQLSFLADEHVDRAYVRALRSNGFTAERVGEDLPGGIDDTSLLEIGLERELVLVTNDRDFVRLGRDRPHSGIVVYTGQGLTAGEVVGAIRRIDAYFSPETVAGELFWLDHWMADG